MRTKVLIFSILLVVGIMVTAVASNTDNLKQQYADGNFYIEYKMTKQDKKGEITKKQSIDPFNPFERFDKFVYAQKSNNKYYQRNDFSDSGSSRTKSNLPLEIYREGIMLDVQAKPISESHLYMVYRNYFNTNDLNIIKNNKIYALDRFSMTGYWTTAEEIAVNPKFEQILGINMIIPTVFNSILFNDKNMVMTFEGAEVKHVLSEDLLCETYTAQKTNEYGSPVGEKWYFQLFYKDGKLVCFSDALSASYYQKLNNKPLKFLNKVNILGEVADDSIFDAIASYEVKKFKVQ